MNEHEEDALEARIDAAARAMRSDTTGRSSTAANTRARILSSQRAGAQRASWTMAAAAAVLLCVGVPTAWAWSTGRLSRWIEAATGGAPDHDAIAERRSVTQPAPQPELPEAPIEVPHPQPAPIEQGGMEPSPAVVPSIAAPQPNVGEDVTGERAPSDVARPPRRAIDPREERAYQTAHGLHFDARDPSGALGAWDQYLAEYPRGRYALEARYNRALCFVRLGRRDEAREALAPFAAGDHGAYRTREAAQLLQALGQ